MLKQKNRICNLQILIMATMLSVAFVSCSGDDEDDFGHHSKYSFVGKTYIYQWTLQNTDRDYQYVLYFSTDSTFTLSPVKVETGEAMRNTPAEGSYEVQDDGTLEFFGVNQYLTRIKGQRITLYKGRFKTEDQKILEVYRYLRFNTGNSRTDWIDFELK